MISMQERGDLLADGRFDAAATLASLVEETSHAAASHSVGVAPSSRFRVASTQASSRVSALARSAPITSSACDFRKGTSAARRPILASSWLKRLGRGRRRSRSPARSRGWGATTAATTRFDVCFRTIEPSWRHKLVRSLPSGGIIFFSLVVERPDGSEEPRRMPSEAYQELISATNMKQRVRKVLEYTWADRLGYAVIGTPNLLEYDQGFFVKGGDGLADVKPIARLYKSQVYALARELGLPEAIATRAPTTETFSMPQTQEEFYFGHPYDRMDLLMWGHAHGVEPGELSVAGRPRAQGRGSPSRRSSDDESRRSTYTLRRSSSSPRLSHVRHRRHRPSASLRRSTSRFCCGWRGDSPSWPRRIRSRARCRRGTGLSPARDLRPATRLAAV